jgi:hypothetical protein
MNYETMIAMWVQQEERFKKWKTDLLGQAEALRLAVEKALSPPADTWTDPESQKQHRYVDIVDITKENLPRGEGLSGEALTPNGALVFGISITLERAPEAEAHPRNFYQVNFAVKYDDKRPEFAFFDPKNMAEAEWYGEMDRVVERVFEKLEDYFSFDPYVGPREELEIGFLKKH